MIVAIFDKKCKSKFCSSGQFSEVITNAKLFVMVMPINEMPIFSCLQLDLSTNMFIVLLGALVPFACRKLCRLFCKQNLVF